MSMQANSRMARRTTHCTLHTTQRLRGVSRCVHMVATQPLAPYGAYTAQGKPQPAPPAVQLQATDIAWLAWVKPLLQGRGMVQDVRTAHYAFLRGYVHDSMAGFYLRGYASGHDMAEKLLQLVKQKAQGAPARNPHEDTVLEKYERESKTNKALEVAIKDRLDKQREIDNAHYDYPSDKWKARDAYHRTSDFTAEEGAIVASSGVFPVVSDADAHQLDDSLVLRQLTAGRREGGGYLLPRAIFE